MWTVYKYSKASRWFLCLAQRAPASPLQRLHTVSEIRFFSLSSLARREDLQMPEAHVLLHIRKKKKKNLCFSSTDPDSRELSRVSVHTPPGKSTLLHTLHSQPLPCPQKELRKTMTRGGVVTSELTGWVFWEALLQDSPGPVHWCFFPRFAQTLLYEKSPLLFLYALRGQPFNMIPLPYYWYFRHVTILFH